MLNKSSKDLFKEIEGKYKTWEELEDTVLDLFNKYLKFMPIGYNYADLLAWGQSRKYVMKEQGAFRVKVK